MNVSTFPNSSNPIILISTISNEGGPLTVRYRSTAKLLTKAMMQGSTCTLSFSTEKGACSTLIRANLVVKCLGANA